MQPKEIHLDEISSSQLREMINDLRTFTEILIVQKICILIAHAYLLGVMFKDLLLKQHCGPLNQNQGLSWNTMEHFVNLYLRPK